MVECMSAFYFSFGKLQMPQCGVTKGVRNKQLRLNNIFHGKG